MKYSILGFNQEKIVAYDKDGLRCDLTDLLLLNYIVYAQANPKMKHILDENDNPCVWLYHEHILNELPILNISEGTLKNRLTKLRKMELITSKTVANENSQGSRTYYRITSLLYDMIFETTSLKNDVLEEPRHSKMTSNIFTNSNTKVKKNNSKELLQNSDFTFGKSKPKKDNLFTKCTTLIDSYDFSSLGNIRKLLIDYLRYRVSVKDKPLYTNMWKGMLNKLAELCGEDVESYESVIKQSIERGYLSFYPVSNSSYSKDYDIRKGKPWEEGLSCETYTPEEKRQIEKEREEMEARGVQVWY